MGFLFVCLFLVFPLWPFGSLLHEVVRGLIASSDLQPVNNSPIFIFSSKWFYESRQKKCVCVSMSVCVARVFSCI